MDVALREQLKTLSLNTRAQSQKGQGVGQEFLAAQSAGYTCENLCRDANYGLMDATLDTVSTDSSGAGAALKAALGNIGTAEGDVATKCTTALTDAGGWVTEVDALRAQYSSIIAAVGSGPIADALGRGMAFLDSAARTGKSINFKPGDALNRFGTALQITSGCADEVSSDISPAKGGKNVSAAARRATSYLSELNGLAAQVGAGAQNAGLTQSQAAQLCSRAADSVDQLIYPHFVAVEMKTFGNQSSEGAPQTHEESKRRQINLF